MYQAVLAKSDSMGFFMLSSTGPIPIITTTNPLNSHVPT